MRRTTTRNGVLGSDKKTNVCKRGLEFQCLEGENGILVFLKIGQNSSACRNKARIPCLKG